MVALGDKVEEIVGVVIKSCEEEGECAYRGLQVD
jgi:hypothetical protein